jgi:hypothetical protein
MVSVVEDSANLFLFAIATLYAGIDPYNKLIDRKPDDNWVDVAKM